MTKTKKNQDCGESLSLCNKNTLLCLICNNDKFFGHKMFFKLDESIKKKTPPQNKNLNKRKRKNTKPIFL